MVFPWQRDESDIPGDSEERVDAAASVKEGLPVDHAISDWGDFEGDYPVQTDVKADTIDEVIDYYDSLRPANITIKDV